LATHQTGKPKKKGGWILVTCWKLFSKCHNFRIFFIKVWQHWEFFFSKNPFVELQVGILLLLLLLFSGLQVTKIHHKNKCWVGDERKT